MPQSNNDGRLVRTVIATINSTPNYAEGIYTGEDIDNRLSQFIHEGWKLFATHHIGMTPQGVNMVYILTKNEVKLNQNAVTTKQ
jgi:hypothetical protein